MELLRFDGVNIVKHGTRARWASYNEVAIP